MNFSKGGGWKFLGTPVFQNELVFSAMRFVIEQMPRPFRIVELGTAKGGLTWILRQLIPEEGVDLISVDITDKVPDTVKEMFGRFGVQQEILNIFSPAGEQKVRSWVEDSLPVLLLCDNGNKVREVNMFASSLKVGDVIMCHDYAHDRKTYQEELKGKYWNCLEIQYSEIRQQLEKHNCMPFAEEQVKKAAWGCFKRMS